MKYANIKCEHCKHKNHIPIDYDKKCEKCDRPLFHRSKSFTRAAKKGLIFIAIFGGGTVYSTTALLVSHGPGLLSRYPLAVEYEIIDRCIGETSYIIQHIWIDRNRKICICALEKTQVNFDYELYKSQKKEMYAELLKNIYMCE